MTGPQRLPGWASASAWPRRRTRSRARCTEDGRGESIWDRFSHTPGAIDGGDNGDVACDHYHRWRADLDLMEALGVESYRFSISWPRVLPNGNGQPNQRGVDFYRRLVEGLLERGIEPIATLYHWDLPQALQDVGGWGSRETAHRFAEYAALMADELRPRVSEWVTHNEPWVVAFLGHAHGVKAPGVRDWPTALRVSHHLLLSHGLARAALRAALPDARDRASRSTSRRCERPATSAEDVAAARRMDGYMNRWFLDPLLRGGYPTRHGRAVREPLRPPGRRAQRRPRADLAAARLPRRELLLAPARAACAGRAVRWRARAVPAPARR